MKKLLSCLLCITLVFTAVCTVTASASVQATVSLKAVDGDGRNVADKGLSTGDRFFVVFCLDNYEEVIGECDYAPELADSVLDKVIANMVFGLEYDEAMLAPVYNSTDGVYSWTSPHSEMVNFGSMIAYDDGGEMRMILRTDASTGKDFSIGRTELDISDGVLFMVEFEVIGDTEGLTDQSTVIRISNAPESGFVLNTKPTGSTELSSHKLTPAGLSSTLLVSVGEVTGSEPEEITSPVYTYVEGSFTGIQPLTTVGQLLGNMNNSQFLSVFDGEVAVDADETVKTGMTVAIVSGGQRVKSATLVVAGDIDGNGSVNARDVTALRKYVVGGYDIKVVALALNPDGIGATNARDVTALRKYIVGGYDITLH